MAWRVTVPVLGANPRAIVYPRRSRNILPRSLGYSTASTCLELLFAALPLRPEHREELRAAISPDWPLAIEQADFLRFEQAMGAVQATIDAELAILLTLISDARPNRYHFQLAHLLTKGHVILTTNFDTLIEAAAMELGVSFNCLISDSDYARYL